MTDSHEVLIAVPCVGPVSFEWAAALAKLYRNAPEGSEILKVGRYSVDEARNQACRLAIRRGFDWIFFLDSDVIPPSDCLPRLMKHDEPIVSGAYINRDLLDCWGDSDNPPEDLVEARLTGAGCLLIQADALRAIPQPWFRLSYPELVKSNPWGDYPIFVTPEDHYFCWKAQKTGFRVLLDNTVRCKHEVIVHASPGYPRPYLELPDAGPSYTELEEERP